MRGRWWRIVVKQILDFPEGTKRFHRGLWQGQQSWRILILEYSWHLDSSDFCDVGGPQKTSCVASLAPDHQMPTGHTSQQRDLPTTFSNANYRGDPIACGDEITILPLLKPRSEKNFREEVSTSCLRRNSWPAYLTDLIKGALQLLLEWGKLRVTCNPLPSVPTDLRHSSASTQGHNVAAVEHGS